MHQNAPPQTPLGELTALPHTSWLYLRGLLLRRRRGKGKIGGKGRERGREERPYTPPVANSWLRHCS